MTDAEATQQKDIYRNIWRTSDLVRWKKKQREEAEKAPGVKSRRGKLVASVGHWRAGRDGTFT